MFQDQVRSGSNDHFTTIVPVTTSPIKPIISRTTPIIITIFL